MTDKCEDAVHLAAVAVADARDAWWADDGRGDFATARDEPALIDAYRAAKKADEPGLRERLIAEMSKGAGPPVWAEHHIDRLMPVIESHYGEKESASNG